MKQLFVKYKPIMMYAIFGVLTTLVNVLSYGLFYHCMGISNVVSNVIAWFLAVTFAYITNKLWVFDSKIFHLDYVVKEAMKFFSCRLLTGILDILVMYIGVDLLNGPSMILKVGSNVLVIILNYVASKLIIFNKPKAKKSES